MKALFWILIGLSIFVLLCMPCLRQPIFENMDVADALTAAKEYVANLIVQRNRAPLNLSDAQDDVDYTDGLLTNAIHLRDAASADTQATRKQLVDDVKRSIVNTRDAYAQKIKDETVRLNSAKALLAAATTPEEKGPLSVDVHTITTRIAKYTKRVSDAADMLIDASSLLIATPTENDKTARIQNVQTISAKLDEYKRAVLSYANEEARFGALVIDAQKSVDDLQRQADNAPPADQTPPTDQTPQTDNTGVSYVLGPDGNMVALNPTGDLDYSPAYYQPGTYRFGSATYVPSYEDSIYLSRTTGQSTTTSYLDAATMMGGSCSYYKDQPDKLEEMCLAVDKNNCGAMSCCVLLGGSKCVSGNAAGPHNKLNYGDITLRDKDYYYHDGKCYGNCKP